MKLDESHHSRYLMNHSRCWEFDDFMEWCTNLMVVHLTCHFDWYENESLVCCI